MAYSAEHSTLPHWLVPRPAQRRTISNNPWLPAACARAGALFAETALGEAAIVLASAHEAAIDYITQAPVLVVALAAKADHARLDHRQRLAAHFKVVCEARPRLRQLLQHYGLALQLRQLSGAALRRHHLRLLGALSSIPPSPLAQAIPPTVEEQIAWLRTLETWRTLAVGVMREPDWLLAWAAVNGCHRQTRPAASEIIDFAVRNNASFDRGWSFTEAANACDRWHARILQRSHSFAASCPPELLTAVADYGPLPVEAVIADHTFTALRSRQQIYAESVAMHHCVALYAEQVFRGGCWLYSATRLGGRVATLELRWTGERFELRQIKAHYNRLPPAETMATATRFLTQINAASAQHCEDEGAVA